MPENNQMMSLEGQLVGMPLAGPESFSQQQLDYLKRALGVDETILWDSSTGTAPTSFPITLSEPITNFERVKFYWQTYNSPAKNHTVSEKLTDVTDITLGDFIHNKSSSTNFSVVWELEIANTTVTNVQAQWFNWSSSTTGSAASFFRMFKIVGIHRIAGGNT